MTSYAVERCAESISAEVMTSLSGAGIPDVDCEQAKTIIDTNENNAVWHLILRVVIERSFPRITWKIRTRCIASIALAAATGAVGGRKPAIRYSPDRRFPLVLPYCSKANNDYGCSVTGSESLGALSYLCARQQCIGPFCPHRNCSGDARGRRTWLRFLHYLRLTQVIGSLGGEGASHLRRRRVCLRAALLAHQR